MNFLDEARRLCFFRDGSMPLAMIFRTRYTTPILATPLNSVHQVHFGQIRQTSLNLSE
jgi:hypothetical protein